MQIGQVSFQHFFDREKVTKYLKRKEYLYLRRSGATIRMVSRRSIKSGGKRNKTSKPGQPPRYHLKGALKDRILFGFNFRDGSVVVGPAVGRDPTIANALEFGGTTKTRAKEGGKISIEPRPFMGPALETVTPKLPQYYAEA